MFLWNCFSRFTNPYLIGFEDFFSIFIDRGYATQYVANTYPYECAGWFWNVYKDINTKIAGGASLSAAETVKKVTNEVRGTTSGYETRLTFYEKAKQIFQ